MTTKGQGRSILFTPIELCRVRARNRVVVSPTCLYSADDGFANDWHFVRYGELAVEGVEKAKEYCDKARAEDERAAAPA